LVEVALLELVGDRALQDGGGDTPHVVLITVAALHHRLRGGGIDRGRQRLDITPQNIHTHTQRFVLAVDAPARSFGAVAGEDAARAFPPGVAFLLGLFDFGVPPRGHSLAVGAEILGAFAAGTGAAVTHFLRDAPLLDCRAVLSAMAMLCFGGRPAAISVLMLVLMPF